MRHAVSEELIVGDGRRGTERQRLGIVLDCRRCMRRETAVPKNRGGGRLRRVQTRKSDQFVRLIQYAFDGGEGAFTDFQRRRSEHVDFV